MFVAEISINRFIKAHITFQYHYRKQKFKRNYVKAIQEGFFPPTINLENQDIEGGCDLDYVANKGVEGNIDCAASGSLGFGGHNGCIIFKKYNR